MLKEVCLIQQFHNQFSQICAFSPWPSILLCDLSSRASLAFSALGDDRNHFLVSFSHRNIIQTSESIGYIIRSCSRQPQPQPTTQPTTHPQHNHNHNQNNYNHNYCNIIQTSESIEYVIRSCRDNTLCTTAIFQEKYNVLVLLRPLQRIVSVMYCTVGPCWQYDERGYHIHSISISLSSYFSMNPSFAVLQLVWLHCTLVQHRQK